MANHKEVVKGQFHNRTYIIWPGGRKGPLRKEFEIQNQKASKSESQIAKNENCIPLEPERWLRQLKSVTRQ